MEQSAANYPPSPREASRERRPWLKSVSEQKFAAQLPKILGPSLRQRGFLSSQMITDWPIIVGKNLARDSVPQRLVRDRAKGTARLVVEIRSGLALEMQHLEPLVIERVNQYFGYGYITKISLVQSLAAPEAGDNRRLPTARPQSASTLQSGLVSLPSALAARLALIQDDGLKQQLLRLGRLVCDTGSGTGSGSGTGRRE